VSYYDAAAARVVYAWGYPGVWNQRIVEVTSCAGGRTSLALDATGWVHLAYGGPASLRYALFPAGE
jgi:hypothetical protein